jgi:glycosyltransferase involved in cell wall biosynthesis
MSAAPEVSVVVPTRDRVDLLLRHGLRSALSQVDVELEVVVVDDGSRDATAERLGALADERVRVVRRPQGGGTSAGRNAGIAAARGRWVAFLDDDDLWAPDKLVRQLAALAAADAGWAYTSVLVVDVHLAAFDLLPAPAPTELAELLRHGNALVGGSSNVIVARSVLEQAGPFDETLAAAEDWDMWLRVVRLADAARVEDPLVATLDHGGRSFFRERRDVRAAVEEVLRRAGGDDADRQANAEWFANELARGGRRVDAARAYARIAWEFRSPGNVPAALGALAGERGLRAAAALLERVRGSSHLDLERRTPAVAPAWLDAYRVKS